MSSKAKIIISCILGVSLFFASLALGISYYKAKGPQKTVSVVGLAEKEFESDLIVLNFSYAVKSMDMKSAYDQLKKQTDVVRKYLKDKGIADKDISFKAINNYSDYDYEYDSQSGRSHNVFKGYVLTQNVKIESKNVTQIEGLHKDIVELLDEGITINASDPSYYYTKLSDLKIEMLAEASKDAHNRAETISKNAGSALGALKSANMGVFQITAPNSSDEDYTWGGTFNTSSKTKCATINMRMTYYVK